LPAVQLRQGRLGIFVFAIIYRFLVGIQRRESDARDYRVPVLRLLPYLGIPPPSFTLCPGQHLIPRFGSLIYKRKATTPHASFQHFTFKSNQHREVFRLILPATSVLLLGGSYPLWEAPEGYLGRVVRQVDVERVPFTDLQRSFKELNGLLPARCSILRSCGGNKVSGKTPVMLRPRPGQGDEHAQRRLWGRICLVLCQRIHGWCMYLFIDRSCIRVFRV
jgi:hypothetical protein